jgi:hypothetical protein
MEARNIKDIGNNAFDMEINHPELGWIPFTATSDDVEQLGQELYAQAQAGDLGLVEPYVPPTPEEILQTKREEAVLSRREFFHGIDAMGMYDAVMSLKDDPTTPRATIIDLETATEFRRLHNTLLQAASQLSVTDTQLDQLFGIV